MADDVEVKFGASLTAFVEGVRHVTEQVDGLKEHVASVTEGFSKLAAALGTAFVGREIFEFIDSMAELGEQTKKTADIFGISASEVGLLNFAAKETGGSGEALIRSLERMSVSLQQAGSHATPTGAAIKALGLDAKELSTLALPDLLDRLRDKFSQLEPGMQRTAVAQALVRGGAETMLPILEMSSEKWGELRQTFHDTGAAMSDDMAAAFAETKEKITTFQTAILGLGERIFNSVRPAINAAITAMTSFVESLDASHVAAALSGLVDVILQVMNKVVEIVATATEAITWLWVKTNALVTQGAAALSQKSVEEQSAAIAKMNAQTEAGLTAQEAMFAKWAAAVKGYINGTLNGAANASGSPDDRMRPAGKAGPLLDFTPPGTGATGQSSDLSVLQAQTAAAKKLLDDQLSEHQITMAQWAEQTQHAVDQEYQAQVALLQKELALGNLKVAQRHDINNKLLVLEQQHATAVEAINKKVHDDAVKQWSSILDPIASAFNSQVDSLLKGTETIRQAIQNIGLDLLKVVIENAIKSIAASAAQTFAGIFANLAPALGPAAAGPATAGMAAVQAVGAGLSSLDVGTWGLPSDMPVMAHKGETVIPAFESGQFRSAMDALASGKGGQGGGDTHHHWNVSAVDARSFVQMLRDNGSELARTVKQVVQMNPSLAASS